MNILIPMAGAGKRFSDEGYKLHKPVIPTIDRRTGKEYPMVVCAVKDLPGVADNGSNVIFVDRDFHQTDGVESVIEETYPDAKFITIDYLTEGQACTCMLAEQYIDNDDELLIAGCDNGMVFDEKKFESEKELCDALVFTYRNNPAVLHNPNAYGWMVVDENGNVIDTSIKKQISDNPMNDHAVVATFWFKRGADFVKATKKMIEENDRINGEFYADQVAKHLIDLGLKVKVFEIDRYLCWGTPTDYELYMDSYKYWKEFLENEDTKR